MFSLKNKTVIVAGGSGLIGKAIVAGLKKQKAKVWNIDLKIGSDLNCLTSEDIKELLPNVFINTIFPKNPLTHLRLFQQFTERMAKIMALDKGGSIINLASIYGIQGADYRIYEDTDMDCEIDYCAVKGGIISLSRALATKYAQHNVRVNCVSPGGVFDNQPESFVKAYCNRVPMGRMAEPNDIVGAVVFLASDESKYVTGQNIVICGGLSAW